ncbi:flagellar basal body protein [Helicobacter pylori]|nr:flagellar basal body protein [Bartonella melophagi]
MLQQVWLLKQTNLDVIANNLANINTIGFKRARAEFADLMYVADRAVGVPNMLNQAIVPEGAMIGWGCALQQFVKSICKGLSFKLAMYWI